MGGGGGLLSPVTNVLFGKPPAPPPAPDYRGAAQETAQGNLAAAQAATSANRVSQYTPYGNLVYSQTGVDSQGNPTWRADTSLAPAQQQMLDIQNATGVGLGNTINSALGRVEQTMGQGFNPNLPNINFQGGGQTNFTRVGQAPNLQTSLGQNVGMEGWDRASNLLMQRLDPQLQRQQERQDAQLAAQGIPIGSQAYTRAKQDLAMQQNDARTQAQLQAQGIQQNLFGQELQAGQFGNQAMLGQNAAQLQNLGFNNQQIQQLFANQMANANFGNTAQQQAFNQALTEYNLPLNTLSALRSGAQVQNPSFVNVPQQATTSGADMLGATGMNFNAQMGGFNAQAAERNNMMQGLFSLGGAALMSDIRLKQNINHIGTLPNGLPFYSFEYIDAVKNHPLAGEGTHIGVMAQEVEQVYPYAVSTLDDGYKVVNYGLLP
jgi:hypothetical protein